MFKSFALATLALALNACAADAVAPAAPAARGVDLTRLTCLVDPRLASVTEDVIVAMDAWTRATDGEVACEVVIGTQASPSRNMIAFVYRSADDLARQGALADTIGVVGKIESTTYIPDDMGAFEARAMMHEIGHALGHVQHDDSGEPTVLSSNPDATAYAPSASDVAFFRKTWGL
jgi:hypothetical protein